MNLSWPWWLDPHPPYSSWRITLAVLASILLILSGILLALLEVFG